MKKDKLFKNLGIVNLDYYFDNQMSFSKKFKLTGIPTTLLLNSEKEEFARVKGDSYDFSQSNFINWLKDKTNL